MSDGAKGEEFSVGESIAFAFKPGLSAFMLLLIVHYAVFGSAQVVFSFLPETMRALPLMIWNSLFTGGLLAIVLKIVDGEQASFTDVFSRIKDCWKYLLAGFISTIALVISFLCLILPGFVVATFISFYTLRITEGDSALQCFRSSVELVKSNLGGVVGLYLAFFGISVGYLIVAGLLVGLPVGMAMGFLHLPKEILSVVISLVIQPLAIFVELALAHAYRRLCNMHSAGAGALN